MKYYVYALIDPKTDRPFYIGKGTGRRCFHHLRPSNLKSDTFKNKVIRLRQEQGHEIEVRKLGLFTKESDAFDFEAELICSAPAWSLVNKEGNGYKRFEHLRADPNDFSLEIRQ